MSLTGKWPISEDTLSDTYMMLPSVVNAIKNPSRACKKREKVGTMIWCYRVLDSTEWIKKNSTLTLSHIIIIICGSWMHYQMILTCVIDVLLFTIYGASICLKVITFSTPVKIQFSWKLNSHHVILPSSPWAFLKCFLCSTNTSSWALPPALAEWTPHYWGTTASSLVSHHKFHSVQWCLKQTRRRIQFITWQKLNPFWEDVC